MDKTKKQIETLFTMAKERNLSPMWTHFYRTRKDGENEYKTLAATACVLLNSDLKPVSRGIAVVSVRDNGAKAYGRLLSLKRAFKVVASTKVAAGELVSTRNVEGLPNSSRLYERLDPQSWETFVTELEYDRIVSKMKRESGDSLQEYKSAQTVTV